MNFFNEFKRRGYFYQCTDEQTLKKKFEEEKLVAYIGFDCTAKSLHVGNLMQVMVLRLLQQYGHRPIVLIGGTTTKIGDPTGKEEARKYLSDDDIQSNIAGIKESLSKFINFGDGPSDAVILNNSEWLESLGYVEFLRNMGRLFSINRMLTMDSVCLRLQREQSLTFLEFNYMLLQAYDFYYLNKNYNCELQLGGSDQWGNIISGVDLVRKVNNKGVYGLTTPLLTTSSGTKMGKSVGGAVWLNESELSAYDYYQYWRNTEDLDVVRFAKFYCEFNNQELSAFELLAKENINEAKKILAYNVTKLCHGKEKAQSAMDTAIKVFEKKQIGADLPSFIIDAKRLKVGINCIDLFQESGLTTSKGEARRLVRGKGARVNDQQITDEKQMLYSKDLINGVIKLSFGKKKSMLIKV